MLKTSLRRTHKINLVDGNFEDFIVAAMFDRIHILWLIYRDIAILLTKKSEF